MIILVRTVSFYHVELGGAGPDVPPGDLEVVAAVRVPLALEGGVVVGLDATDPVRAALAHGNDYATG